MRRAAVVALLALAASGCSDEPGGDPAARAAVAEAFGALANPDPMTIGIELPDATANDLFELSVGIDRATAALLEGLRVTVKDDFATDPSKAIFSMRFDLEAGSFEVRQLEEDLYVRGDLGDVMRSFGVPPQVAAGLLSQQPALRPLVRPALRGDWIHVYGAAPLLGSSWSSSGQGPSERAAAALAKALEGTAVVTERGEDDVGVHYQVDVDLVRFTEALYDAARGLIPRPLGEDVEGVPDETVTLDVWLHAGELRRIETDVAHLIDIERGGGRDRPPLLLRIDLKPYDGTLPRPDPVAQIPAATLLRVLGAIDAGA